ncbi:hypothetical protein OD91_1462 [Lutibacter sp. Hel_I_33_5]|uniref:glycosyltransferase n=1 Tax=Lutibacter sp. Hel_I_33_5 TaxID=1566289 RepID=UPI0011A6BFC8|nr:glycosyltransferase [Lutibacter sp. Hel_I_33_5]TVZ56182.1 hypothetical protein OD91_1462 [Lutibacter sp. Hel_I_33_5]
MDSNFTITASIVIYNEDLETLKKTINSFLQISFSKKLYLIDNSSVNKFKTYFKSKEVEYIFVGKNLGFGKAHNLIIDKINGKSEFHLVLNPDVVFNSKIIFVLISELEKDKSLSMISPKVLNFDGTLQFACRKFPTFFDLINRRVKISNKQIFHNTYQDRNLDKPFHPDFIQGCYMLFKTEDFIKLNGFDERYFLYMEDVDICKKIDAIGKKKLYFPNVEIIHQHRRGSSKKIKLLFYHLSSAIKYYLKWGV